MHRCRHIESFVTSLVGAVGAKGGMPISIGYRTAGWWLSALSWPSSPSGAGRWHRGLGSRLRRRHPQALQRPVALSVYRRRPTADRRADRDPGKELGALVLRPQRAFRLRIGEMPGLTSSWTACTRSRSTGPGWRSDWGRWILNAGSR